MKPVLYPQGVVLDIDDDCMTAFETLYRNIYDTSCPKFNLDALSRTRICEHFFDRVSEELTSESDVMLALRTRMEDMRSMNWMCGIPFCWPLRCISSETAGSSLSSSATTSTHFRTLSAPGCGLESGQGRPALRGLVRAAVRDE